MSTSIEKGALLGALIHKFGFEPLRKGGKHEGVTLIVGGKKVASTRFSRGKRSSEIGPSLLRQIATQLRLGPGGAVRTLDGMVSCTVSKQQYLRELKDGGYLD